MADIDDVDQTKQTDSGIGTSAQPEEEDDEQEQEEDTLTDDEAQDSFGR